MLYTERVLNAYFAVEIHWTDTMDIKKYGEIE